MMDIGGKSTPTVVVETDTDVISRDSSVDCGAAVENFQIGKSDKVTLSLPSCTQLMTFTTTDTTLFI